MREKYLYSIQITYGLKGNKKKHDYLNYKFFEEIAYPCGSICEIVI